MTRLFPSSYACDGLKDRKNIIFSPKVPTLLFCFFFFYNKPINKKKILGTRRNAQKYCLAFLDFHFDKQF